MVTAILVLAMASNTPEIRVGKEGWNGGPVDNIHAVLKSTADDLLRFFPERKLAPILVERGHHSPIVLYAQGPNGEIQIQINSEGTYWSQYAYQFSHELTHVLCGFKKVEPNSPPNAWFEESICMMASLFTMRQMAETWKTKPPYPNWKDYAPALKSYADDVMARPEHQLKSGQTLAAWYKENEDSLRKTGGGDRQKQSVVANVLLRLFEHEPEMWPSIGYLNVKKTGDSSFKTYMDAWHDSAPYKYRKFIQKVRTQFE